jgi:2'-5' RNA ligase
MQQVTISEPLLRLFFALWPDEQLRAEITSIANSLRDSASAKWVRREKLHLTLVFLGSVEADKMPLLEGIMDSLHGTRFCMMLDRVEVWRRSGVICLTPTMVRDELLSLVRRLRHSLGILGIQGEARPYHPHVTLARKAYDFFETRTITPVAWPVNSFSLIRSHLDGDESTYEVLYTRPLD